MATTKKILIVDDEPDVRDVLEKKLKSKGYEVSSASCGNEAFAQARIFHPDLAILDIMLADTDGYTIASGLREYDLLAELPIIFMTGKDLTYEGIEEKARTIGNCNFILKPCAFEDLLSKIREILTA